AHAGGLGSDVDPGRQPAADRQRGQPDSRRKRAAPRRTAELRRVRPQRLPGNAAEYEPGWLVAGVGGVGAVVAGSAWASVRLFEIFDVLNAEHLEHQIAQRLAQRIKNP